MLKATIKNSISLLIVSTLFFVAGCASPEEKRAKQELEAQQLIEDGGYEEALQILEGLAVDYPNDIEILTAIGQTHAKAGDHTLAAFFLEQAQLQAPEDVALLHQTYSALEAAGQPSGAKLARLAELSPESLSDELWLALGAHLAEKNQIESALNAYLTGADLDERIPPTEAAASIGQLFVRANNLPQAEKWFVVAAQSDDANALTALFGLLDLQLRQKRWVEAEKTIALLDEKFPGAVDASEWKQARAELAQWREAQERMKARLAKITAEKKAAEEAKKAAAIEAEKAKTSENKRAEAPQEDRGEPTDDAREGKLQIVADLEAAEAMADMPAIEAAPIATIVAYDPSIAIEPADPSLTFSVEFDDDDRAPETTYSVGETVEVPVVVLAAPVLGDPSSDPLPAPSPTAHTPRTFEELLADAETAEIDRDFKSAIRKYWSAIGIVNDRPSVWNRLSRAYLVDGQLKNAETTALEAIRLEPNQVSYTLDYLRVAQRSRPAEEFLAQLETAYDRFPANVELTLSLARAHERVSRDRFTARNLYQRFVDLAPNHPLVPEAQEAIARLR